MSSVFESLAIGLLVLVGAAIGAVGSMDQPARQESTLRVCADPNNMPFSDRAGTGFENEIADLIGRDLHQNVAYTWRPQRRGFLRQTLNARRCDVVLGIPAEDHEVLTTRPYYRSTYVFVQRSDLLPPIQSLDDPRLAHLRIGIHVIGDDYNSLPPGVALARRGLVANLTGFSIYGDYNQPSPPHLLVEAVADGAVDVGIAWGPLVGYYTRHAGRGLSVTAVPATEGVGGARFVYDIAMGVRLEDTTLQRTLDELLVRRQEAIDSILRRYSVPAMADTPTLAALGSR